MSIVGIIRAASMGVPGPKASIVEIVVVASIGIEVVISILGLEVVDSLGFKVVVLGAVGVELIVALGVKIVGISLVDSTSVEFEYVVWPMVSEASPRIRGLSEEVFSSFCIGSLA